MFEREIIFWSLFLLFNYIQFLPNYIFNYQNAHFLPFLDKLKSRKLGFFSSPNMDAFRYLIEVSVFVLLLKFNVIALPIHLLASYYILLFIYNFYHNLFRTIYQTYPSLYNDWPLILTGLAILWKESKIKLVASILAGLLVSSVLYFGFLYFLDITIHSSNSIFDYIAGIAFFIPCLYSISRFYIRLRKKIYYAEHRLRFILGFLRIIENIRVSIVLSSAEKKIQQIAKDKLRRQPDFETIARPNIFFLFIESYGSILLYHKEMVEPFRYMGSTFQSGLESEQWKMASTLSEAPSASAFSWLCYATFLHGFKISRHVHYDKFLRHPLFLKSDSLMRIFKNLGYKTCFLNPIQPNPNIKIDYKFLTPFYAVDQWILYDDFNYKGNLYGFGDFPPDQYSINRGREIIEKNTDPYVLLFLTKNSHSPFVSPGKLAKDWRMLNAAQGQSNYGGGFLARPAVNDYLQAMQYQLDVIADFILNTGKKNDIYFVLGDHQPPILNHQGQYALHTPIHVISKNDAFIKGFKEYGFRDSLFDDSRKTIQLEAMYSVILREFMRNFGAGYIQLPEYEPYGLRF